MNKTDRELHQAIREKLQSLKEYTPSKEVVDNPWSSPQPTRQFVLSMAETAQGIDPHPLGPRSQGPQQTNQSPQEIAIEALKQRAAGSDQSPHAEALIAQELYRLEEQAHQINLRSRQQAADLLELKRVAHQAALNLARHGIQDHPQLPVISKFFEAYPEAALPRIEKDNEGLFSLIYDTVDLQQAEQQAAEVAHTLRQRQSMHSSQVRPFQYPIEPGPPLQALLDPPADEQLLTGEPEGTAKSTRRIPKARNSQGPFQQLLAYSSNLPNFPFSFRQLNHRRSRRSLKDSQAPLRDFELSPGELSSQPVTAFSWLDGAIWFSGAAILRILIRRISLGAPLLEAIFLLILFCATGFLLYQILFSKKPQFIWAYRLCIAILGTLLGNLF